MTTNRSVFARAVELRSEARRRGDASQLKEDALKIGNEVDNSEENLGKLENSLAVVEALRSQEVQIDPGPLDKGLKNFEKHAASGLPSRQAVQSASNAILAVHKQVQDAVSTAWAAWTSEQINQLPTNRLAVAGHGKAALVRRALDEMKVARIKPPTDVATVKTFVRNRDKVNAELSSVEQVGPHLRVVLEQLVEGSTLDQLSDDDIVKLRETGWDKYISVKRAYFDG